MVTKAPSPDLHPCPKGHWFHFLGRGLHEHIIIQSVYVPLESRNTDLIKFYYIAYIVDMYIHLFKWQKRGCPRNFWTALEDICMIYALVFHQTIWSTQLHVYSSRMHIPHNISCRKRMLRPAVPMFKL